MRTRIIGLFALCLLSVILLTSCGIYPNKKPEVIPPPPLLVNNVTVDIPDWVPVNDYNGKVVLAITFSTQFNTSALTAPGTVDIDLKGLHDGRTALNVAGTFRIKPGSNPINYPITVVFISNQSLTELINPKAGENIEYSITISETLKSISGNLLDGDVDGHPGGNYRLVFEVVT
jgi:hypothetical protein